LGPKVHEECLLRIDVVLYIAILYCRNFLANDLSTLSRAWR
jgi:hypothetical protein